MKSIGLLNKITSALICIQVLLSGIGTYAVYAEDAADLDIYLAIGQSNMAGRASIEQADCVPIENAYLFNAEGAWEPAQMGALTEDGAVQGFNRYSDVRKTDGTLQGLSPAYSFAKLTAQSTGRKIGIVSNARGATTIKQWAKGYEAPEGASESQLDYDLYEKSVARAVKAAQAGGKIAGVIWHQGEAGGDASDYMADLKKLVSDLKTDLKDYLKTENTLPFVAGTLAGNYVTADIYNAKIGQMTDQSNENYIPDSAVANVGIGETLSDNTHLNSQAQRDLGEAYAYKMLKLVYGQTLSWAEQNKIGISAASGGSNPELAFDGAINLNAATGFWQAGDNNDALVLDLGKTHSVSEIRIYWGDSWRRTNRYNIYAKSGQSTWQKICDRSEINTYENLYYGEFTADEFAGITADYIKIEPVEIYDRKISEVDSAATAHIAEIEIFGKEMPAEGSRQAMTATDIRLDSDNKSVISNPNYPPAILSDGLFGNSQGSYAIYFGAANARMTPSVILKGEATNVTHIAIYAGVSGNADMVDAGGVRVYNYNESTASYEEIGISGYDTVDNGTNTGLNNSASESSVRANQIVFLKLDRAVRTNELKVEFNQSTPFRICETEAYYAPQNKLFGKAMSDFAPEYPESEFGKNIINGGFVLTDGERQGCFDHKIWSVNNTADDVYAEYGVDGEKINRLVVYSGNGEGTGTVDAVELEYTVDGTDWVKADFEKEEQTGEKLIAKFDSIYPKKIRVHILSPETVVVREIEAYDDSVTAPIEPEYFDADGYDYDTETNALCSTQLKQISFIGGKCINERIIADGKAGSAAGVYSSAWVIDEGENACAEFFFSSPVAVNKIQLTSGWRDMSEDGIVSDITLQIYEDGEYTDIAVITGNTSKMAITSFPVVSASRYRVLLGADNAMRIREIQLNYAVYAIAFEKEFGNDGIITTGRCDNRIIAEYDGEYTVELTVNGEATAVDEAGRFTLDIDKNGIYELCAVISDANTGIQLAVFTKTLIAADFSEIIRQINDGESSLREFRQNLLNNSALAEKYGYDVSAAVNDSDGAIGLLIEKLREKAPYEESPAGFERLIDDIKNAMPGCSINGAETGGQMQYALENYAGILGFDCNEIYDFAQQQKTEVSMIAAEIVAYREKVLQGRLDADNYAAAFRYAMAMTAYNISYYGSLSSVFDKYSDVCSIDYSVIENKYLDVTYRRLKSFHVEKYTDIPALLMKAYNDTKSSAPQNTQSGGGSGGGSVYYKEQPATNPRDDDIKNETEPYRDMNGYEWAKESVARLTELGVVSGKGDGEFCPGDNVTREQFIKMIVTAMQLEIHETVNRFEDVTDSAWYSSYVLTGCSYGITRGISETVFGVGMPITRQDMAVITYRAAECRMYGFKDDTMSFADEADISDYALTAVRRMAGNGIINGVGDNCFAPKNLSTRAEAAVMICRLLTSMEGK